MENPFRANSLESAQEAGSPLAWETLLQIGENSNLTLRKRDRPLSFDAEPLQFPDGVSPFPWDQDFLNNQNGDGIENESGQLFGGYGERVGSFVADSGSSAGNPNNQNPVSTAGSSDQFPPFDLFNNAAPYSREVSNPLPRPAVGSQALFTRQVSDPLPATVPAVAQLAPSRSQRVVSKSMNLDEIYTAYAQSWGGALKAVPKGGAALQRKPQGKYPPKRTESKTERAANAAKAEAAGIIRDLFKRPGAKRQAVPLEMEQVGSLERGFSQLASSGTPQQLAPAQAAVSGSLGENVISPAQSQSTSLPPIVSQSDPSDFLNGGLGLNTGLTNTELRNTGLTDGILGSNSNDLAALQKEAQVLLAAMGGSLGQGKAPPARAKVSKSANVGSSFTLGGKEEPKECSLVRAVEVAGCQVALVCPVELDGDLFLYNAWESISNGKKLETQVSDWGSLDSVDWLLQTGDGVNGLRNDNEPAGPSEGFSAESSLWPPELSDLMANPIGSVRKAPNQDPSPSGDTGVSRNQFHHLWAQLELSQLRDARFRTYRTAYREEVRRLRIWTGSFVGDALLSRVADLHFVSCNTMPNRRDRHVRMMLTKGMLWNAFVTHSLGTASPVDIYFARQDGSQAYKGTKPGGLDKLTAGMQLKCKNMCFVAEDLKDESTYGPEAFRTYGALRKSVGFDKPPPPGNAGQQVTFPELTDPKPGQVSSLTDPPPELIQIDGLQSVAKCTWQDGVPIPWGMLWMNKQRLLSTGRGMRAAGERGRVALQALFERTIEAHVEKYDVMASGAAPTLDRYLNYARYESGAMVSMGLAFCAIGQGLADAAAWEPTVDEVEQLFEETARATELAGNVLRIMSDLRTYQADLVQLRLNAVAIRMREADCSHKEALEFLAARAAADIEALGAEIKAHAAKGAFAHTCWRLPFELCRVGVALFTVLGADARAADLFEVGAATVA